MSHPITEGLLQRIAELERLLAEVTAERDAARRVIGAAIDQMGVEIRLDGGE